MCQKDVLPTEDLGNVVYLFDCVCGHSYVRQTSPWLTEQMRRHVPV